MGVRSSMLEREDGRQVLELRPPLGDLGIHAVDRLDLEEAVILLRLFWRTHLPNDKVAGAQPEAADLALGDVHIFRAGVHVLVGAQETDAVLDDFQRAAAKDEALGFCFGAQEAHDEVVLLEPRVPSQLHRSGDVL